MPRRKRRILVVEDDEPVRTLVAEVMRLQGHDVLEAANGAQAIELAASGQPDLVLVDWVLPDISGTEVILELRRQGLTGPVVMLTARSAKMDEVVGLEVGADDYITKPFDSRILAARINAHLRRAALAESGGGREGLLMVGALQIDNAARRLRLGEDEIPLTMTEFNLLSVLAANPERVLTRAQLRDKVWGYPHDLDDHSVDPHVQRLRRKLSEYTNTGVNLEAVPGLGYRLSVRPVTD
ncbi:MAG TPA: response regulator transcription factor [Candidatus Dormibacteraeota bacterium]